MSSMLLILATLAFAIQAIRAQRLLHSAIWLAGVSALLAILFYQLGAHQVAVIELSVGAGLVTVLFVFAIGMAGEDQIKLRPLIPRPLVWGLVIAAMFLLGWLAFPFGHEAAVLSVAISPQGEYLASAGADNAIHLRRMNEQGDFSPHPTEILLGHSGPVNSIQFSPDGTLLASASSDTTLRLWDITDLD